MAELTIEQQVSGYDWLKSLYLPQYDELSAAAAAAGTNRPALRLGRGAGPAGANLLVIPFENRLDWRPEEMTPSTLVWCARDIFTTHNGSWEVNPVTQYSIDQWARDAYLRASTDPLYYPDGGGDHHIHVVAYNGQGQPYAGAGYVWTSQGVVHLQPPMDPARLVLRDGGTPHGWANIPIWEQSQPPAQGPWAVMKLAMAADIVLGFGMPFNWHVGFFVVYEAMTWQQYQGSVTPPPPDPVDPTPPATSKLALAAAIASTMTSGTRGDTTIVNRTLAVLNGLEEGLDDE